MKICQTIHIPYTTRQNACWRRSKKEPLTCFSLKKKIEKKRKERQLRKRQKEKQSEQTKQINIQALNCSVKFVFFSISFTFVDWVHFSI